MLGWNMVASGLRLGRENGPYVALGGAGCSSHASGGISSFGSERSRSFWNGDTAASFIEVYFAVVVNTWAVNCIIASNALML